MSAHASSSRRRSDCYAEPPNSISPPVEEDAGDDQQRCHRQHVRKCLRCCPLCGFLHAVPSLDTGHDSSLRKNARNVGRIFKLGTPRVDVRFASPHSASVDGTKNNKKNGTKKARLCCSCVGLPV